MAKLADLFVKLGLNNSSFNKGLKDSEKKTSSFGKGVAKIGGLIAGAFAVTQIVAFGKELLMLGGIAEGVRAAFNRIADDKVLEDLKNATRGTVSELELMKRAVSAQNLGLPVEKLAKLFEFATKRAQETGESVDFLVNSIVTGIGRKSPLILDNLGISAIDLRKKLKGVGMETATVADIAAAVGEIAADSMRKSGEIIDTNAIKVGQLSAAWADMKVEFAEDEELKNTFGGVLDFMTAFITNVPQMIKDWDRWGKNFQAIMTGGLSLLWRQKESIDENTESQEKHNEKVEEFANLLGEVEVNAKENNKLWEKKFKAFDKLNDEYLKSVELTEDLDFALNSINKIIKESTDSVNEFFDAWLSAPDISGIVGGGGVFGMFSPENEEDLGFDTEAFVKKQEETQAFLDDMNNMMEQGVEDFIGTFAEGLGRLAAGDIGFDEFFNVILDSVGQFLGQMGKMLIAYGFAMEAFKKAFSNPFVAIAAGVALVAIGGAISGLASKGPSGAGSVSSGGSSATGYSTQGRSRASQDTVIFELRGDKLIGVINNTNRKNSIIG